MDPEIQKIVDSLVVDMETIGGKINGYRGDNALYCNKLIVAIGYIDKAIYQLNNVDAPKGSC